MEESHVLNQSAGQPWVLYKHVLDLNGPRALDPTLSDSLSQTELRGSPYASPNNSLAEMNLCVAFVAKLLGRKSQVLLTGYLQTDPSLTSASLHTPRVTSSLWPVQCLTHT